jgi:SET domain-containing protein
VLLEIRPSPIQGQGAFAASEIPSGSPVVEYCGEPISKQESIRRCAEGNAFIFYLNEEQDLDGSVAWNPARFLNHSCAPNAQAERRDGRIWLVARRLIRAGEEVTFDYGYDLESFREHPCACGSPGCVGYIVAEEYHSHLHHTRQELT